MATTKNTQYWEEHKPASPLCLCYSQDKGLYTKSLSENEDSDELLYRPQGYVGFVNDTMTIPNLGIEIEILSNFDCHGAPYLKAVIKKDNNIFLDYDTSNLYILNKCSIKAFNVPLYDWDRLFEKIINACKEPFKETHTAAATAYITEIINMLDKYEIFIYGNIEQGNSTRWIGKFLVALYAGSKIRDLLKGYKEVNMDESVIIARTLDLCRKYIHNIKSLELNYNDSRVSQIADTLILINEFMCTHEAGIEYLYLIGNKST